MSVFDSPIDAPFQIKTEGETIEITFSPGLPVTGQGTVQWNIPAPAHGCTNEDNRGAYCGIVILLKQSPLSPEDAPVDGTYYDSDATADVDAHAGDKIGDALVVGAFYEGEQKSRGEQLTTSHIINDLKQNTPYYVAGYAVDCQGRYHRGGVRAYSDEYQGQEDPDTPSTQIVTFGDNSVIPTDGTSLTPGFIYEFEVEIDPTFPDGTDKRTVKVSVDGTNVSTYEDLITEINKAIALADNPPQSPQPLNNGRYYWNAVEQKLYQWDGESHNQVDVLIEPTDPATPTTGDYWYDTSVNQLKQWDTPTAGVWNVVNVIEYEQDPLALTGGDDYWFDGTNAYSRCGDTWCQETLHNTTSDPSVIETPTDCGVYWYDETNEKLFEWDLDTDYWKQVFAIMWDVAPNNLTAGTYWFDETNDKLYKRSASSPMVWEEIVLLSESAPGSPIEPRLVVSEDQPSSPIADLHWYKPSTEQLFIYNGTTSTFVETSVLVWPTDPTDTQTCDLWWDTTTDSLYKWDVVHAEWDLVSTFTISTTDPFATPTLEQGELWYNPDTEVLQTWNGTNWVEVTYISYPTDPTIVNVGDAWFNPTTNVWNIWATPLAGQWNTINPIDSDTDPFTLTSGTLWFDTTNNSLFERSGTSWIAVSFSTIPFTPAKGDLWFDTSTSVLKEWNGITWVESTPLATAEIDENGNIKFTTSFKGSSACIMILVPQNSTSGRTSTNLSTGDPNYTENYLTHDYIHYGFFRDVPLPETSVPASRFLFDFLSPSAKIMRQIYGTDGVDRTPSYDTIGVGDDGSEDERRELADSIRSQLGYPTIEVELTPYQINTAIDLALESLRKRSSAGYKRGFFFLNVVPGYQHYKLTDKTVGFHKVVTVMSAHRFTSAFLSSAHGAGVYGQVVLQHLYNMGTFDLLSYHLVSQYVEQMEHLFATRLTYHWDEPSRVLAFYHAFAANEKILLDVTVERTEQEIFKDRWTKTWVERYALAESMRILAQIRGKYASLPGAGGGIALNAADLMSQHDMIKEQLYQQIDDYIVNDVEDIGLNSTLIIG